MFVSAIKHNLLKPTAERVGFISPLYWYGLPKIVYEFIEMIDLSNTKYCFATITAMYPDGLALEQVE